MNRLSKFHRTVLGTLVVFLPTQIVFAADSLQEYLSLISGFINNTLIPFFFAIAILFLFVNVFRYFILKGDDSGSRDEARKYILYAVIALVFLTSIWGIIALFVEAFDLNTRARVCPDYNPNCGSLPSDGYNSPFINNAIFNGDSPFQSNGGLDI